MEVWVISTPTRRSTIKEVCKEAGCSVLHAFAAKIRADLIDCAERALETQSAPIILDALTLDFLDVISTVKRIKDISEMPRIIVILPAETLPGDPLAKEFVRNGICAVVLDDDALVLEIKNALENPSDPTYTEKWLVDPSAMKGEKLAEEQVRKVKKKPQMTREEEDEALAKLVKSNSGRGWKFFSYLVTLISENALMITVSIILTVVITVTYYAMAEKGLTLADITRYLNDAFSRPFKIFIGR